MTVITSDTEVEGRTQKGYRWVPQTKFSDCNLWQNYLTGTVKVRLGVKRLFIAQVLVFRIF